MKIRSSLYRVVFTLVVLPFLLFSVVIIQIYSGRLERVITESLRVVADAQITEMSSFCEQQKDYLTLMGTMDVSREAMKGGLGEDGVRYLDNILLSYVNLTDNIKEIALIDRENRVVASSDADHREFAENGIGSVIEDMGDRQFYISDVLKNSRGEKTIVEIARIEEYGVLLGYAVGELNLDFYGEMRERAKLWNESTFYLLDGNGKIISAGTSDEAREDFVTEAKDREDYNRKYSAIDFEKNPQGSFQYRVGGTNYITYYSDAEYTEWRILLTVNMDTYRAERIIYVALAGILSLLCAALALWIGWFASKRIVRPVQKISGTLKAIQKKQDYSLRVEVERMDELGILAEEINELINFIETEDLYKTQRQRFLQEKAGQDALTKVMNKERISQYLQKTIKDCRQNGGTMAVMFVDIDDFKAFNTQYGHSVGDQVLMFFSSLLARKTGVTVGRVGGDEFLAVVEDREVVQELDQHLTRLEEEARKRFVIRGNGAQVPVTCCIGAVIVDFSQHGACPAGPEQVVQAADDAMYQIKNHGKKGHLIVEIDSDGNIVKS